MTQNNLYMEDDEMMLYVDVQPLYTDALENSKNSAEQSAQSAQNSAVSASNSLNSIINYKNNLELFYAQANNNLTALLNNSLTSLTNAKETALENVQSLKNTVLNNINTTLQNALNSINTIGQNIINQAKGYAQDAQNTVDNRVSEDYLIQSNALASGAVSQISNVLSEITNYVHSTFDKSKFTIVGSPVITDDGIASGFSSSNYLILPVININNKDFEIYLGKIHTRPSTSPDNAEVYLGGKNQDNTNAFTVGYSGNKVFYVSSNSEHFTTFYTSSIASDTDFYVKAGVKNSIPYISWSADNQNWTTENGTALTQNYITIQEVIGVTKATNPYLSGSIDLKQFSITVDGVEVFSGNKTGIDTIKPDDYTVVGTPTISADGVASWFSSGLNYVQTSTAIDFSKPFEIYSSFKLNDITSSACVLWKILGSDYDNSLVVRPTSNVLDIQLRINNSLLGLGISNINYIPNVTYQTVLGWDGTTYYLKIKAENETTWREYTTSSNSPIDVSSSVQYVAIGKLPVEASINFNGSIDLNAFKIYVDGDLVYQPCLKIPYTLSKTGSKIVDAVYRDRVNDMAIQFGYANYYTLDGANGNFTLPQGEIYGMIENLRKLIIDRTS